MSCERFFFDERVHDVVFAVCPVQFVVVAYFVFFGPYSPFQTPPTMSMQDESNLHDLEDYSSEPTHDQLPAVDEVKMSMSGGSGGGPKAQDHNSSRSNKTASIINPGGGGGGGGPKSQDHNSSRSNKSGLANPGGGDPELKVRFVVKI